MSGIVEALNAVMVDVGAIGKNQQMKDGPAKYAYRGIEDILPAVHQAFVKHGVVAYPTVTSSEHKDITSKSGTRGVWCCLTVNWTFMAADGSSIVAATVGEAADWSDKASNKAMTAAQKYAYVQVLCIPTGGLHDEQDAARPDMGVTYEPKQLPDGWGSWEDCDNAHDEATQLVLALPEDKRTVFRTMKKEHGWPMAKGHYSEFIEAAERIAAEA